MSVVEKSDNHQEVGRFCIKREEFEKLWFPRHEARQRFAPVALSPMAWLANRAAVNREASAFTPNWTSVVLELEVARKDVFASHCAKRATSGRVNAAQDTT